MSATPKCVEDALAELERQRTALLADAATAQDAEEARATFPSPELSVSADPSFSPIVSINAFGLTSMRQIQPVLAWLRGRGWKLREHLDVPESRVRVYPLERDDRSLTVRGFLLADAACRYEQVGVKEVPVYKLVCPDQEEAEPASEEAAA